MRAASSSAKRSGFCDLLLVSLLPITSAKRASVGGLACGPSG
jgi:hypothetical protein